MLRRETGVARDPWFDNARWLAGSLVVMVHVNDQAMQAGTLANWLHGALQPARVPLFAFLVGFFTPLVPAERHYAGLLRLVVLPFVAVWGLHVLLNWASGIRPLFNVTTAPYTLWFLYSVISWRLICPALMRVRRPLLVAVLVSLASGALDGLDVFSLRMTLGLLPFVVLGMILRRDDAVVRNRSRRSTLIATSVIVAWLIIVTITKHLRMYDGTIVGMNRPYAEVGISGNLEGMALRLAILLAVGATMLAVLHLTPRRHIRWITTIGAAGFTIYLLHGLVLRVMRRWDLLPTAATTEWWSTPVYIAFPFLLAAALGSKPVRWLAGPLVRPRLQWLLAPEEHPVAGGRRTSKI